MLSLTIALLVSGALAQTVTLPSGTLQGGKCSTSNASYFYSVPYAQPPTGDLRFAPPQAYNGTYGQATARAPNCIQFGMEFIEVGKSSEDCLYLDIWVPPNAQNLPVKAWIYGGGNTAGSISDPTYNGCNLATDSIVVSINYRLGPLGFLALESGGVGGNMGTQDQLLGLQWIQSNIRAFGGDPAKVVLFGQSAGAEDTYVIGTLPRAPHLLAAGISESGGGGTLPPSSAANAFGAQWAGSLNCSDASCLRSLSVQQLNISLPTNPTPSYNPNSVHSFGPFVDGDVIPRQPSDAGVQVPFIFGSTTQEGTLLILSEPGVTSPLDITPDVYAGYLESTFGSAAPLVASRYPVSAFNSSPYPAFTALVQVITDTSFFCPAYHGLMKAAQIGTPAWTYLWGQAPTCPWYDSIPPSVVPGIFGAAHTAEIPFVFANVDDNPPPNGTCNFTTAEKALSKEFVGFWTSMAASGSPGTSWPEFTTNASMGLNVLNGSSAATPGVVDYSVCAFWDSVLAAVLANSTTLSNGTTPGNASSTVGPPVASYTGGASLNAGGAIALCSAAFTVLYFVLA